jgi:hypothetical protein
MFRVGVEGAVPIEPAATYSALVNTSIWVIVTPLKTPPPSSVMLYKSSTFEAEVVRT